MNLLAHLHLSEGRPVATAAGNLLADYMRRLGAESLDDDFAQGLRLHHAIDAYAEAHPRIHSLRACFSPARRRLGGIILDVACDHFLSRDWSAYSPLPLRRFVAVRLEAIQHYLDAHVTPLRALLDRARAEAWLLEYGTMDGLRRTFERISHRSPAAFPLRGAEEEVEQHQLLLQAAFDEFYPQLIARCVPTA